MTLPNQDSNTQSPEYRDVGERQAELSPSITLRSLTLQPASPNENSASQIYEDRVEQVGGVVPESGVSGTFVVVGRRLWRMTGRGHCTIRVLQHTPFEGDIMEGAPKVSTLPESVKHRLLGTDNQASLEQEVPGSSLLQTLHEIDDSIATNFGIKAHASSSAPLRLLTWSPRDRTNNPSAETLSFIALSYCWHSSDWVHPDDYPIPILDTMNPISGPMLQALLGERQSAKEGIWIDQLCINQSDEEEKRVAIGSMDIIYKKARLVVIVLEDIRIEEDEEMVLRILISKYENKELFDLRAETKISHIASGILWKVYSARWFSRAWCSHELRVSDNQIFFIRVGPPVKGVYRMLRISADFLHDLSLIEADYCSFGGGSDQFVSLRKSYQSYRARFSQFVKDRLDRKPGKLAPIQASQTPDRTASYMRVFAEIFALGSSVPADKLVITLNILNCGLYFRGSAQTENECCRIFTFLALAARDPTALSNCGKRLILEHRSFSASWMKFPRPQDIREPFLRGSTHRRLDYTPLFNDEELTVDTLFVASSESVNRASSVYVKKAEWFLQGCIELRTDEYWLLFDSEELISPNFDVRKKLYIDALACALEGGVKWIKAAVESKGSLPNDYLLETAFEVIFDDRNSHEQDFGIIFTEHEQLFERVVEFLDALLSLWLSGHVAGWSPAWFQVGADSRNRSLILCPLQGKYRLAIPAVLLHEEYDFLNRIWIVGETDQPDCWVVLGKVSSFGIADFREVLQFGTFAKRQRFRG
ncbi:hypothetical protein FGG08_003851 [Glutinoglossum americanum]|uniref:Heterokaryon incompatibility domain-containing protein n=1 Tax=Glutinoglossum americanum TaxID=1670608 RepID=A0A9P8L4E9_9PEZI|nr:hypothetical protein FGG08_003851 [Glutinoglossum americanum]